MQLLAAEPHATAERKRELRIEAVRKARQSPLFFDLTISLSKSISIFHASLGENARLARQAGDQEGDLRGRAARFEQRYGRAPSQRELAPLAQASNFETRAAKHGALDLAQLQAG